MPSASLPMPVEKEERIIALLREGMSLRAIARVVGGSHETVRRVRNKYGGVLRPRAAVGSRYLDEHERLDLARLHEQWMSICEIAAAMGRHKSTISRELRRNCQPRSGRYLPYQAQRMSERARVRPKKSKLETNPALCVLVQAKLRLRWTPEEIAGWLARHHGDDDNWRVSHESIYKAIYVYPRGEVKRLLTAELRSGRTRRQPRGRRARGRTIVDAVPIGQRPAEVDQRLVIGHHEGDLIKGSLCSNSAVGTLVERVSGYLTLVPLPDGWDSDHLVAGIQHAMAGWDSAMWKSLTWDRGTEMAPHKRLLDESDLQVYFADPYAPWQRGSNENTNGIARQYLPKGADLNTFSAADLRHIQDEINDRPRKRLEYQTPREVLTKMLQNELASVVASTA